MAKSAKNGTALWNGAAIGNVTNIDVSETADEDVYASNSTAGVKNRLAGHEDTSGSFDMMDAPPFTVGQDGVLTVKDDASTTVFHGGVLITEIARGIPIEDGSRVVNRITWGAKTDADSSSE